MFYRLPRRRFDPLLHWLSCAAHGLPATFTSRFHASLPPRHFQRATSTALYTMGLTAEQEDERCRKFRDEALSNNPSVRFMFKHLRKGGCNLTPDTVHCRQCDAQLAGGFQDDGSIMLCSNHVATQAHASNTLVHESIHAFDACRAHVDWSNCVHHACSEIRAATLSGDCNFSREFFLRRNFALAKQFQKCVKRRALLSVSLNPYCNKIASKVAVDQAWDSCYHDTAPFDKIP